MCYTHMRLIKRGKHMINLDDIDITQTPPTHEPERQYYYMAKARQYVKKKSEELGRPLTLF